MAAITCDSALWVISYVEYPIYLVSIITSSCSETYLLNNTIKLFSQRQTCWSVRISEVKVWKNNIVSKKTNLLESLKNKILKETQ